MQQLRPNQKYWAELVVRQDGKIKVKRANKYNVVNQHSRSWTRINARELARAVNQRELVIR